MYRKSLIDRSKEKLFSKKKKKNKNYGFQNPGIHKINLCSDCKFLFLTSY